jgi:quinol monooxygenase YgiN
MDPYIGANGDPGGSSLHLPSSKQRALCTADEENSMTTPTAPVKLSLLARLEAKPGKEAEVEAFLRSALALAADEPLTVHWFALRLGTSTFGVFDTFANEDGRAAHLSGPIAAALAAKAPELFAAPPVIERVDLIAVKA